MNRTRTTISIALTLAFVLPLSSAAAQSRWLGGSGSPGRVLHGSERSTDLGVWVDVPADAAVDGARAPMALALVIDTSGSMRGEKIQHAREAAVRFIETLQDGDYVAVYSFDYGANEIVAPTRVNAMLRPQLAQRVRTLAARGGTNIQQGLLRGQEAVRRAPSTHTIRRVVLISDGQATEGATSANALGAIAANGAHEGIGVASIGVGSDYSAETLQALAVQSSGRNYHVRHSRQMAEIVATELQLLQRSAAIEAEVVIVPAPGVTLVSVGSLGGRLEEGRAVFPMGTVYADQHREFVVRARVSSMVVGQHPLAHVSLRYRQPGTETADRREDLIISYHVTSDALAVEQSESPRVVALAALQSAATAQLEAAQMIGEGDSQGADRRLARVERSLDGALARTRDPYARRRLSRERAAVGRRRTVAQEPAPPPAARAEASRAMASESMDAFGY